VGVALATLVVFSWFATSFVGALTNPALGTSLSARAAEWARGHGGGWFVNWAEAEWYRLHPPKTGGAPNPGSFAGGTTPTTAPAEVAVGLPIPARLHSPAGAWLPGEGVWHPVGRTVKGAPAIYTTTVRPDAVYTSYVVGVAWMDPRLLTATLYSGSQIPGGGPYAHTAPITPTASRSLDASFNAGFRMQDAQGGYYTEGHAVIPLRTGAASLVTYRDGSATVGAWNQQVSMTPQVTSVRQNLAPIVNNGAPVPGLDSSDNHRWGQTLGGSFAVWRSGVGVTRNGALVYVGGPSLTITSLARLLVDAGAVRAMELDINTDWVQYSYFSAPHDVPVTGANGAKLLANMSGPPSRYFANWWVRDFFTMSVRPAPLMHPTAPLP
jgi:Phosphodiester glycosidase